MSTNKGVLRGIAVFAATITTALFFGVSPASADNGPHRSTAVAIGSTATTGNAGADRCAACHRAHTGQAEYLLAAASEEDLCYTCHGTAGTGATTNVQDGLAYGGAAAANAAGIWPTAVRGSQTGALRGGGFENAQLGTNLAWKTIGTNGRPSARAIPVADGTQPTLATSSHLGGPNTMWGNGVFSTTTPQTESFDPSTNPGKLMGTAKLECGSCHDPHGNGQYRILRPVPTASGFNQIVANTDKSTFDMTAKAIVPTNNATAGIWIKDTVNKVYTTTDYWMSGDPNATDTLTQFTLGATSATNPSPAIYENRSAGTDKLMYTADDVLTKVSSFQSNVSAWCTTCHTRYLAGSGSYKNTSGDAIFTYRHRSDRANAESGSPNCTQCHVAHGTNAVMNGSAAEVAFPGDTAPSADSRLLRVDNRGVCVMCHNV